MLHEFGHVMGMDHRTDGSTGPCVMTTYLNAGQIKRSFCADEKGLMLGFYGTR
jgi:predicted Zn-dependent protease